MCLGEDKKGLGIIFHSGDYARVIHALSISLAALTLDREVRLFFTYWPLEYLKKNAPSFKFLKFDSENPIYQEIIEKNLKKGHLQSIPELIAQNKKMGAKFYVCTNSMALLNIARDELIDAVDKSMGIITFLTETKSDQILFI